MRTLGVSGFAIGAAHQSSHRRPRAIKVKTETNVPSWVFTGFEYSVGEGLRKDGRPVDIQPEARQMLELSPRSDGALVNKTTIAAALWPRKTTSDESIARVADMLRRALGDSAGEIVRTVYGEGLRRPAATSAPP